jgi:hypothetical protein
MSYRVAAGDDGTRENIGQSTASVFQARYAYCRRCKSLVIQTLDQAGLNVPCYSCDTTCSTSRIGWFWAENDYDSLSEAFGPFDSEQAAKADSADCLAAWERD